MHDELESNSFRFVTGIEYHERLENLNGADIVLRILRRQKLTIGRFLLEVLGPPSRLNSSSRQQVHAFLAGRNVDGHPLRVIEAIINHPDANEFTAGQPTRPIFRYPPHSIPPNNSCVYPGENVTRVLPMFPSPANATAASTVVPAESSTGSHQPWPFNHPAANVIREFCTQQTMKEVEAEMECLADLETFRSHDNDGFSWPRILSFRFSEVTAEVLTAAPVLWILLTTAAIGSSRSSRIGHVMADRANSTGRGSNNARDPWLVCTFIN